MLGVTANGTPLLPAVPTVTTTLPVVAPAGTGAVMLAFVHWVGVAAVPLNVNVPAAPKLVPMIVTGLPNWPAF
jgi:hypothetical protein